MEWLYNRIEPFLPKTPKTIAWLYIVSISVVLLELLIALAFFNFEEKIVEKDASFINLAGRQSMLSQRIILSAERLKYVDDENALLTLKEDIHEFERNLAEIIQSPSTPKTVSDLLFGTQNTTAAAPVFEKFIDQAKIVSENKKSLEVLDPWGDFVRKELLPNTQSIADAFEADAEANLSRLRSGWTNSILIASVILGLEVVFVFLPSQRMLLRAFSAVQEKNAELQETNTLIEVERNKLLVAISETDALRQEQAEFTYALSHDMKAPANTVRMIHGELSELLTDHPDEEVAMFLDLLISTTNRMGLLVEDVLDYTTTLGEMRAVEKVDLNTVCKGVIEDLTGDLKAANGSVELANLPIVKGCPSQLRMLFQNLVSNGIKFRPSGQDSKIQINCVSETDAEVAVKVTDNGIGIAPEDQEKIFGLFSRLHLREDYAGTGLGLALCRRIVANHSGRIELSSELGKGSEFTIHLPKKVIL